MKTAKVNQKEYLKKYLGRSDDEKKKKKKKYKLGPKKVKIIDDDVDLKNLRPLEDGEFEIFNSTEDAPQIAGIVDERGPVDFGDKKRWKIIADDGEGNVAISSSNDPRNREDFLDEEARPYNRSVNDSPKPKASVMNSKHNNRDTNRQSSDVSRREKQKSLSRKENNNREMSDDDLSPSRVSMRDSQSKYHDSNKNSEKSRQESGRSTSKIEKNYASSNDDLSPPRSTHEHSKRKFQDSNRNCDGSRLDRTKSSHRKEKHYDSDDDLAPPRVQRRDSIAPHHDSNNSFDDSHRNRRQSPSKKENRKHTSNDDDLSPPRVRGRDLNTKFHGTDKNSHHSRHNRLQSSPKRGDKLRTHYEDDLSPPRVRMEASEFKSFSSHDNAETSRRAHEASSKKRRNHSPNDDDMSPPRRSMKDTEFMNRDSNRNPDFSRNNQDKTSRNRKSRWTDESRHPQSPPIDKRMKKTLDGKAAGLQDAATLKEETAAYKKREADFFDEMSAEVSGVGKAAVLRDRKTGRRRNLEAEAAYQREKEKRQEEIDMKYAKWGRGLKQVDDQTEKLKQDLYEMSKPLARYADDADLDAQLRAADREGDPMREYIKQKQIKEGKREPDRPTFQGSFMPNRFGIKPGHRWDGVDRSNGYEKKWFEARNARTAVQEEAYKWSTSDM